MLSGEVTNSYSMVSCFQTLITTEAKTKSQQAKRAPERAARTSRLFERGGGKDRLGVTGGDRRSQVAWHAPLPFDGFGSLLVIRTRAAGPRGISPAESRETSFSVMVSDRPARSHRGADTLAVSFRRNARRNFLHLLRLCRRLYPSMENN